MFWATLLLIGFSVRAEYPTSYQVEVFDSESTWESIISDLDEDPSGLLRLVNQLSSKSAGNCGDKLQQFQQRPVDVMHSNDYITLEVKKKLLKFGRKPSQLILVRAFSILPRVQANALFTDKAELTARTIRPRPGIPADSVAILRGNMWAVRGFEVDPSQTSLHFRPLPLLWEIDELPDNLKRPLDSTKFIYRYEIGRALSEDGVLPGNFKRISGLMAQLISSEGQAWGLDSKKTILFAQTRGVNQARSFSILLPFRILSTEVVQNLEQNPQNLDDYAKLEMPKGADWAKLNMTALFVPLTAVQARLPIEQISETARRTSAETGGMLSGRDALYFFRDYRALFRREFTFNNPHLGRSAKPLMALRLTDATFAQELIDLMGTYGLPRMTSLYDMAAGRYLQAILNLTGGTNMPANIAPDGFMSRWYGSHVSFHPAMRDAQSPRSARGDVSYLIANLDPELLVKWPRVYLPMVLVGVRDQIEYELGHLESLSYNNALAKLNQDRAQWGKPRLNHLSAVGYFDTYGLAVDAPNAETARQLKELGGRKGHGDQIVERGFVSGSSSGVNMNVGMGLAESTYYLFDGTQLTNIANQFPAVVQDARASLQVSTHPYRIKQFYIPTF